VISGLRADLVVGDKGSDKGLAGRCCVRAKMGGWSVERLFYFLCLAALLIFGFLSTSLIMLPLNQYLVSPVPGNLTLYIHLGG